MQLYRFSPIKTEREFNQALEYVAGQVAELTTTLTGQQPPITSLKIFAHYPQEYPVLKNLVLKMGEPTVQSATSLYVNANKLVAGQNVPLIGIRVADPYRFQVGCADVQVPDAQEFHQKYIDATNGFVRDMPGREQQFIELWHPDFDVAAYIKKEGNDA